MLSPQKKGVDDPFLDRLTSWFSHRPEIGHGQGHGELLFDAGAGTTARDDFDNSAAGDDQGEGEDDRKPAALDLGPIDRARGEKAGAAFQTLSSPGASTSSSSTSPSCASTASSSSDRSSKLDDSSYDDDDENESEVARTSGRVRTGAGRRTSNLTKASDREPKRRRVLLPLPASEQRSSSGPGFRGSKGRRGHPAAYRGRAGLRSDDGRPALARAAKQAASFDSDDVEASLLDEPWGDDEVDYEEFPRTGGKRDFARQYPVIVNDPERRDIGELLVAAVGPGDDKSTIADKYRETITDLLRRGCLRVVVDGVEKRIPFSEEHVYSRGEVFARCWMNEDKYNLRLRGNAWSRKQPIIIRVYTDKATMRSVTSVTWNGRHCSESAEMEFEGGSSAAAVHPPRLSRAPVAEAVASNAAVSRVTRPVRTQRAPEPKRKRGRPRRDAAASGKRVASSSTNEIIVIDSDDDEGNGEELLHPLASNVPETATNETRPAAVTASLLHGNIRVKQEPNPRVASTRAKEIVLRSEDGTSLVAEFQKRAADFQRKIAAFRNVDLGFVYEETMEKLLKEGRVYAPAHSIGGADAAAKLFSRKAMPFSMTKRDFFEERSWKMPNQLELRLAERTDTAGNAVTPRIFINTAEGDQNVILSITWNRVHLTNESEILYT
jgi:hypothetical protein